MNAFRSVWRKKCLSAVESLLIVGLLSFSALAQEAIPDSAAVGSPHSYGWTYRTFTIGEIQHHPARTLEGLMLHVQGVTRVNSNIYVRGSRAGEVEYRFGGIPVLDRWSNTNAIPFIPEMLERVTIHTGAYGPALGSFGGGVVEMQLREAGDALSVEASYLTDDFAKPGEQFLGTSSYGWHTAVLTLGTPLPFDTKLFVAGEISRQANRQPMYLEPISITLDRDAVLYPQYLPPPEPFEIERNHVPSQSAERSVLQWNLTTRFPGPLVEFFGSVSSGRTRDVTWPTAVRNYYRQRRIPWREQNATFAAIRVSEDLLDDLQVSGAIAYARQRSYTLDPDLGESWRLYADSAANAQKGYPEFRTRYYGPRGYSSIVYFFMEHASAPSNTYEQESSESWTTLLRAQLRISDAWKIDLSGEAEWWTLRRFSVGTVSGIGYWDFNSDGIYDYTFTSEDEERVYTKGAQNIENFGFTFRGSETDGTIDAPRRPSVLSASASTSWREDGLSIDAGLRGQWLALGMPYVPRQLNPSSGGYDWQNLDPIWDYNLQVFREGTLTTTEVESYALPRLSIRYETANVRVHAAYGEYVETLPHQDLQLDDLRLSGLLDPWSRVPYNLGGSVITFQIRPSRTSHAEIGAEYTIAHGVTVSGLAYHKTMTGQAQMGRLPSTSFVPLRLVAYANTGESDASGVEVGIHMQPSASVDMQLRYAWSQDQGLGSFPRSNREYYTDEYGPDDPEPPPLVRPLVYDRTHRVLASFEFTPGEESRLHGLDLRTIATIESGTPYTKEQETISFGGSATPWMIAVRGQQDQRTFVPVEPLNASRTPWIATVDLSLSYGFQVGPARLTLFVLATNLLDTKNIVNVYPRTNSPSADGWLNSEYAQNWLAAYAQYAEFYRVINLQNRWAYMSVTGNDMYGIPRQMRFGVKVGI